MNRPDNGGPDNKGKFRSGPISAFVDILALSQSERANCKIYQQTQAVVFSIRKKYSEEQHLVNSRHELLTTRQQFCGNISTLFRSHCQTRINYFQACYHTIYKETRRNDVIVM